MKKQAMMKLAAALLTGSMVLAMMSGAVPAEDTADKSTDEQTREAEESIGGLTGFLFEAAGQLSGALEEDSPVLGMFEEGGLLSGLVPEGTDVKELAKLLRGELDEDSAFMQSAKGAAENADQFIEDLSGQLSDQDSELYQMVSVFSENADQYVQDLQSQLADEGSALYQEVKAAAENLTDEDGSLNEEAVSEIIGLLIGGTPGYDDLMDDSLDGFVYPGDEVYETCREYVKELNKDTMDEGDVQLVAQSVVQNAILDDGTVRQFGLFSQQNYALDGSDLKRVSAATDVFLFTLTQNEDGSYTVTDTERSEDGEKYQESLVRMCEEMGVTEEKFYTDTGWIEASELLNNVVYMEEHPEIEHMEYMGEMLTPDEMRAKMNEVIAGLC